MPETHDLGNRFVTTMRYPSRTGWPFRDPRAFIREIEPPYRIGSGTALRFPGLRTAVIVGRWDDEGGEEVQRLTEALRASDAAAEPDEIRGW